MNRRRTILAFAAALLIMPLAACASPFGAAPSTDTRGIESTEMAPNEGIVGADASTSSAPVAGQSVIHSGDATIVVSDPRAAASEVRDIAERLDGYIENESVSDANEYSGARATLTLRVPATEFTATFEALDGVGDVVSQTRSAADVTIQHVDLLARVDALQASVDRLTDLMSGAATTGELIEAEAALSQRQQELDGLRAQLQALESQIDYSSIWVSLETKSPLPGGPANFWEGLVAGFESMLTAGSGALVIAGILLPWVAMLAVLAGVVILIVLTVRRGAKRHPRP